MSDNQLKNEIITLERKLKLLLSEHRRLKEDLNNYRSENEELKQRMHEKDGEISSFQNSFKISKIVDHMAAGGDNSTELKEVIDQYIKEIDKCIVQLSEV